MSYFVVFNKKGYILFESGNRPPYLNSVIRSINLKELDGTKNIQDNIMEYKIHDQEIYLSISSKPSLKEEIQKYRKLMENDELKNENTSYHLQDTLNYSDVKPAVPSIIDSIKKVDFKRTFSIFSGKINLEDLKPKMVEHLVKKNVDPNFCKIITNDVIANLKDENTNLISETLFKTEIQNSLKSYYLSLITKDF